MRTVIKKIKCHLITRFFLKKLIRTIAVVFSIATSVITFMPLDELLRFVKIEQTFFPKVIFLFFLLLISFGIAVVITAKKKKIVVSSSDGKTLVAEYSDITSFFHYTGLTTTVVIPINTDINTVVDVNTIRKDSIHGQWLQNLSDDERIAIQTSVKNDWSNNQPCQIGKCFFIDNDSGTSEKDFKKSNVILLASCSIVKNEYNDYFVECSEQDYFLALQSLIQAILGHCERESVVYVPLISSGYANSNMRRKKIDYLKIMAAFFSFYIQFLPQNVHIVVSENSQDFVDIFAVSD